MTKFWSLRLDFAAKMASSHDATSPCDLLHGIVAGTSHIVCADGKVKALGVWLCIDCEESKKKNYEEEVHKVEDILNNWRNKRLTLIGKISVIKALAASQLVYVLSSTASCLKSLKETNNLPVKFLWDNKGDKISGLK